MNKTKIPNEESLLEILCNDIRVSEKEKILILAGHFPLTYGTEGATEDLNRWGPFSKYTLQLGCDVGKYAKSLGKETKFVFFVDDHFYENAEEISKEETKRGRHKLYKCRSGSNALLPKEYHEILKSRGFDEKDVLRQNQNKKGREDCLYFSEKILRASKENIENPCAREYVSFFNDSSNFDKQTTHLVAFIPHRCSSNICDYTMDNYLPDVSASHVFVMTQLEVHMDMGLGKAPDSIGSLYKEDTNNLHEGVFYRRHGIQK